MLGWNNSAWGAVTPPALDAASHEPTAVAAAFLLASDPDGASVLLKYVANSPPPLESVGALSGVEQQQQQQHSTRRAMDARNIQSCARRHAVDALACCRSVAFHVFLVLLAVYV